MIDRWLLMMNWMGTEHTAGIYEDKEKAEKRLDYLTKKKHKMGRSTIWFI